MQWRKNVINVGTAGADGIDDWILLEWEKEEESGGQSTSAGLICVLD